MSDRSLLAVMTLLAFTLPALAHKMDLTCTLRGDKVRVEAFYVEPFFDDSTPAQQARVRVETGAGERLAEGRTDDRGIWEFARPASGSFTVFVSDGTGHAARKSLVLSEEGELSESRYAGAAPTSLPTDQTPGKEQANRFPYAQVVLGVGTIVLLAGMTWWILHDRARRKQAEASGS